MVPKVNVSVVSPPLTTAALLLATPAASSFCVCASLLTVTLEVPARAVLLAVAVSTVVSLLLAPYVTVLADVRPCAAVCSADSAPLIEPRLLSLA